MPGSRNSASWTVPPDGLTGVTRAGGFREISSDDLVRDLYRLTKWALDSGVRLDGLEVRRPTLEDVYLSLTAPPEDTAPSGGAS